MLISQLKGVAVIGAIGVICACGGASERQVGGPKAILDTSAPFAHQPDFDTRLQDTIAVALTYWGGTPDEMNGRSITFVDDPWVECSGVRALGCFDGSIRLTTRDPSIGTFSCVEATVLVHEIGHVVLGDRNHTDPRWMEMDAVAAELGGRPGYTDSGETVCQTYVSVWRHPLGSP